MAKKKNNKKNEIPSKMGEKKLFESGREYKRGERPRVREQLIKSVIIEKKSILRS